MGMSCLLMPFVIGYSRVPEPPARMMPRMSAPLPQGLGVRLDLVPGREPAGVGRLLQRRRLEVARRQPQLPRLGRELEPDRRVERVDAELPIGVIHLGD